MLLVCESPEIPIILYVLYIRIILKGTELAEVGKSTNSVVVNSSKIKGLRRFVKTKKS